MVKKARKKTTGRLRFDIRLLVRHPSNDLTMVTDGLGLTPDSVHLAGENITTPAGTKLPGRYYQSAWGWSKWVEGKRDFFNEVASLCLELEKHKQFIGDLLADGADIEVILHLPGDVNAGSSLPHADIKRLADLGIDLGLEVFPKMNR